MIKKSLKYDDKTLFSEVEEIYRIRNNIAHQARAVLKKDNVEKTIEEIDTLIYIRATEQVFDWIEKSMK
ncbi:hypothetical protein D3C81_2260790 [compost metagenome]